MLGAPGIRPHPTREKPMRAQENTIWCNLWWDNVSDERVPRVLLIGDSVTNGYTKVVRELLSGRASVDHVTSSRCIADPSFRKEVAYAMESYDHEVVHFNNGLHGVDLSDDQYAAGLRDFAVFLLANRPNVALIWASSTPRTTRDSDYRLDPKGNAQVIRRNEIAGRIMEQFGIPVNDLYSAVVDRKELKAPDTVHFNATGSEALGKIAAERIIGCLD